MEHNHWDSVVSTFTRIIGGDPVKAISVARETFHEIARCGDVEHSQAVAEAWMRILGSFIVAQDGEDNQEEDNGD